MKIFFVLISISIFIYIINDVKKNRFSTEESIFWIFASLIAIFLSIFPKMFDTVAKMLKINYSPSLFFLLCILFLLLINFRSSRKLSVQQKKIVDLAQNIAILNAFHIERK